MRVGTSAALTIRQRGGLCQIGGRIVGSMGGKAKKPQLKHRRKHAVRFVHNAHGKQQQDRDYDYHLLKRKFH